MKNTFFPTRQNPKIHLIQTLDLRLVTHQNYQSKLGNFLEENAIREEEFIN